MSSWGVFMKCGLYIHEYTANRVNGGIQRGQVVLSEVSHGIGCKSGHI